MIWLFKTLQSRRRPKDTAGIMGNVRSVESAEASAMGAPFFTSPRSAELRG